jgi:hypothetical protein
MSGAVCSRPLRLCTRAEFRRAHARILGDRFRVANTVRKCRIRVTGSEPGTFIGRAGADHLNGYGISCLIYGPGGRTHRATRQR